MQLIITITQCQFFNRFSIFTPSKSISSSSGRVMLTVDWLNHLGKTTSLNLFIFHLCTAVKHGIRQCESHQRLPRPGSSSRRRPLRQFRLLTCVDVDEFGEKKVCFSYMEILFMKNECLLVSNGYLSNGLFIVNRYDSDVLVYYVIEW